LKQTMTEVQTNQKAFGMLEKPTTFCRNGLKNCGATTLNITTLRSTIQNMAISITSLKTCAAFLYCCAECHYAECRYADCHILYCCADCRYAECRGADLITWPMYSSHLNCKNSVGTDADGTTEPFFRFECFFFSLSKFSFLALF
jgi:hypothetical protein